MFVLCPHCHFLVGIDPRTGTPPANCPKCGGVVVAARPEPAAEQLTTHATALEPFAPIALPSVGPVLLEPPPGVAEVPPAPALPLADALAAAPAPAPTAAEPEPEPAAAPRVAIEPAPTAPRRKPRWWSWRKGGQSAAEIPAAPAEVAEPPSTPVELAPAEIRIAPSRTRRRVVKQSPAPAAPPTHIEAVEVAIDAIPPAVGVADPAETSLVAAAVAVPDVARIEAPVATSLQSAPPAPTADTRATVDIGDSPAPSQQLRRVTDTAAGASPDPTSPVLPRSHPLRRRTDVAAPSFTRPPIRTSAASRIRWRGIAALAGLSLLLALQLLLAQRDTLAASPRWRPTITLVCATLRCTLPPWREPAAFTMLSRDVRPHPGAPGTLLINASFRNDARWPQPWPGLLLTLSDLDGRMVGARDFAAREYLGVAPTQSGLAPGQTAAVSLVVVEPAPDIVAFTFDFR